ncbi:MAG: hypothetical protein ACOH2H_04270 [Cypionkella sp.]
MALAPLPAQADTFARLSGTFGDTAVPAETCAANPVFVRFTPDHARIAFSWANPVPSYTGAMITAFAGTLVAVGPDSITMLRDNETRVLSDGSKIVWTMRATSNPEGFCWTRPDWPSDTCFALKRCGGAPNS